MNKNVITIRIEIISNVVNNTEFLQYIEYFLEGLESTIPVKFILYLDTINSIYNNIRDQIINKNIVITNNIDYSLYTFDLHHDTNNEYSHSSKFYFTYTDYNSFITNLVQLFSAIKALLNHKESINENRNDGKHIFYKKAGSKRYDVDDKKRTSNR